MNSTIKMRTNRRGPFWASIGVAVALVAATPATAFAAPSPTNSNSVVATSSSAESVADSKLEKFNAQMAKTDEYMRSTAEGDNYFDTEAAKSDGVDAEILKIGDMINGFMKEKNDANTPWSGRVSPPSTGDSVNIRIPVYGNWCGPGESGQDGGPVNTLDSLCMKHDNCYAGRGYLACSCDRELVDGIYGNIGRMGNGEASVAVAIATVFSVGACNPFK